MSDNDNVTIRLAKTDEIEEVKDFLRTFFFKDEPCNKCLKVITEEKPICKDMETFTFKDLDNGLTLVAIYDKKIVGVCINSIVKRDDPVEEILITDEQFVKVTNLLSYAEQQADIFGKFPEVNKILNILILSVDPSLRGKGIAKQLCKGAKKLAKEQGAQLIAVECTSFYSAAIAKSIGFELIYALDYEDYKINGEVVIKPEYPHKLFQIFVCKL